MKYLDLTGLRKFWAKVKTLVTNALVGYAKTSDIPADYTVISLSADSGTLTTDQLTKLKANPHKTVLKRSGYCYFVEDLSSSTIYKYSRNIYHSNNKLFKQVISITTSSGAYTKTELDYTYTHPTTHHAGMITGLAIVATSGSYNDLSNKPSIPSIAGLASESYVNEKVAGVVNSAPETLDTLKELSQALGDDPNFATTVANKIGNLQTAVDGKSSSGHTHDYAGSDSAGGAANYAKQMQTYYYNANSDAQQTYGNQYPVFMQWNSTGQVGVWKVKNYKTAVNLLALQNGDLQSVGSATQPVYFSDGTPVATTHTLGKSVPADAKFTDTTYSAATQSAEGLMSSSDKSKLDGLPTFSFDPTTGTLTITSS